MNYKHINILKDGLSTDLENGAESKTTFKYGINGRLTSNRGVLSYSSLEGTEEIYNNASIVKYLGWFAFEDELILMVKYNDDFSPTVTDSTKNEYTITDQSKTYAYADIGSGYIMAAGFNLEAGLDDEQIAISTLTGEELSSPLDKTNIECTVVNQTFFEVGYVLASKTIANYSDCTFDADDITLENNKTYADAFISISKGSSSYSDTLLWKGFLNWDINRKIIAVGLDENIHTKKVYFTDNLNPFRMFNRHDPLLAYKLPETFDVRQNVKLPQPKVQDVRQGGLVKSMTVLYTYRLITKDGVVTAFSPLSNTLQVYPDKKSGSISRRVNPDRNAGVGGLDPNRDGTYSSSDLPDGRGVDRNTGSGGFGDDRDGAYSSSDLPDGRGVDRGIGSGGLGDNRTDSLDDRTHGSDGNADRPVSSGAFASGNSGGDSGFRGGDISEVTNKMIVVGIQIPNHEQYDKIECLAIEYEIQGVPTSIKTLGIKDVLEQVMFYHTGTEKDVSNITLLEVISNGQIWKYNKSMSIIKNKLVAGGLRLDPYPINIRLLEDMFLLKGWDIDGDTHDCLINPEPYTYKYIDPANTDKYKVSSKVQYSQIKAFDTFTLKFYNRTNSEYIEHQFINNTNEYVEFLQDIHTWLLSEDLTTKFPNLTINASTSMLLFERTAAGTLTDLDDYQFSANTKQLIVEKDSEYELETTTITDPTTKLVHGAVSYDFNIGTGIRLSWFKENDKLLSKAPEQANSGKLLALTTPTLKKGFMKGEIYRLGVQGYKNGDQLFVIPLGDIQVPAMGDEISYIDKEGNAVITTDKYKNQYVEEDILYSERIMMKVEVRFGCEMKDFIDSYQIVYVERTEDNRTILAQGISAPLQRMAGFEHISISGEAKVPEVFRKWTLPYMGGPLHEINGFATYDKYPAANVYSDYMPDTDDNDTDREFNVTERIITHRGLMYFDSPDIIYNKISTHNFNSATVEVLGRLKTDHNRNTLSNNILDNNIKEDVFSKYSVIENEIKEGNFNDEFIKKYADQINALRGGFIGSTIGSLVGLPFIGGLWGAIKNQNKGDTYGRDSDSYGEEGLSHVRTSVFSNFTPNSEIYATTSDKYSKVEENKVAGDGLIIPGEFFDLDNPVSNNALTLGYFPAYYSSFYRRGEYTNFEDHDPHYVSELLKTSNKSVGYRTVFLKTTTDIFTDEFIGDEVISMRTGIYKGDQFYLKPQTDAHALINIKIENKDIIYGGRTKYAFSKNIFIPLSKVVDMYQDSNTAQVTSSEGDTYTTLYFRTKNDYNEAKELKNIGFYNQKLKTGVVAFEDISSNIPTAWNYAVVLESTVEERLSFDYRHYREDQPSSYDIKLTEFINPCYSVINNLKSMIPLPFLFKDNPLALQTLSVSKVKINGDYYDSFLKFLANDIYELEKQYGEISNVITYLDQLYVIQKKVTSLIKIDQRDVLRTEQAAEVQLVTGTGRPISNHKIISYYGTGIARGYNVSEVGITFFDESKLEFVRMSKGISTNKNLSQHIYDLFGDDPIINSEVYYDGRYKETNIMLETTAGVKRMLSYNELLQVFNGWYGYDSDVYIPFAQRVLAPTLDTESSLQELNKGDYLNFFGTQQTMKIKFVVVGEKALVNIYKALSVQLNTSYKIKKITLITSLDEAETREITSTHFRYKIKEGIHTVPLRNINDRYPLRSEWMTIELEIESIDNKKVDLFSITSHLRISNI